MSSRVLRLLLNSIAYTEAFILFQAQQLRSCFHVRRWSAHECQYPSKDFKTLDSQEGYKWLHAITVEPDSIDVVGSPEAVFRARLHVNLPDFLWDGNHAFDLPVEGLGSNLTSISKERIEVRGASALWTENKFEVPLVLGSQIVDVEVWVSGPKKALLSRTFEELITLSAVQNASNYTIVAEPVKENISVLSITPNRVERIGQ